jgi:hypothetical protein
MDVRRVSLVRRSDPAADLPPISRQEYLDRMTELAIAYWQRSQNAMLRALNPLASEERKTT